MAVSQMRRVRTLRLTAPDEALIQPAAVLLEDALRTASVPSASGGRLLLVRSLSLGNIRITSSSTTSLLIELRLRQLSSSAIHAEDEAAPYASAVYFRDIIEAYVCLALRLTRGEPTNAWFWRMVSRHWSHSMPRDEALRTLLVEATQTDAGPAGAVAMVRLLAERGALDPLFSALRRSEGSTLLRAFGWAPPVPAPMAHSPVLDPSALRAGEMEAFARKLLATRWLDASEPWFRTWGSDDARSLWLAGVLLSAQVPMRLEDPRLMTQAKRLVESVVLRNELERPVAAGLDPKRQVLSNVDSNPGSQEPDAASSGELPSTSQSHQSSEQSSSPVDSVGPEQIPGLEYTCRGGLFFTVPLLTRLGIANWLAAHPEVVEQQFPARLLCELARRLSTPADDLVLTALRPSPDENQDDTPIELQPMMNDWIRQMRRWCRLKARIGLSDLVCRRARISSTATHIDMYFQHSEADSRIRRAGLDIDPGWVAWLGWVIQFHYIHGDPENGQ
jgi:hypothetical protein